MKQVGPSGAGGHADNRAEEILEARAVLQDEKTVDEILAAPVVGYEVELRVIEPE